MVLSYNYSKSYYLLFFPLRFFFKIEKFVLQFFQVRFKPGIGFTFFAQGFHQTLLVAQVRFQSALQLSDLNLKHI